MIRQLLLVVAVALAATAAHAERLPFTTYTARHGLAADDVNAVVEDERGFLWIGTYRGLSRFDGRSFRTFGREHGLNKSTNVISVAFGKDGTIWVGAWDGLYRFDLARGGSFIEVAVEDRRQSWDRVHVLVDRQGRVWCASLDGLFLIDETAASPVARRVPGTPKMLALQLVDRWGSLWIGGQGLWRRTPDGTWSALGSSSGWSPGRQVNAIAEDRAGQIWIATIDGLWRAASCPPSAVCPVEFLHHLAVKHPNRMVSREGGGVWVGTAAGLLEIDGHGRLLRTITYREGLLSTVAGPVLVDRAGDLWVTGNAAGLQRLRALGLSSFDRSDGIEPGNISPLRARDGTLLLLGSRHVVYRREADRFIAIRPALPREIQNMGWGWYQVDMLDSSGAWWVPTDDGLVRFANVRRIDDLARPRTPPTVVRRGCFPGSGVFRLYEDTRGDLWIGTVGTYPFTLFRRRHASGDFECHDSRQVVGSHVAPTAFLDDGRGTLWIGFGAGQIARLRGDRFECVFDCGHGSRGRVQSLFLDRRRRLWVATHLAGVFRADHPNAEQPVFAELGPAAGLSSTLAFDVLEDRFGHIYVTGERGIDVFDDESRRVKHLGEEDGLPHAFTVRGLDVDGTLWFGTTNGLARFTPPAAFPSGPAPTVAIDRLTVAGVEVPISAAGERAVGGIELAAHQRSLQIQFVGLPRSAASALRFQHRLSPDEPWSEPSADRSIVLAGLASGRHLLEIRALDAAGTASAESALVSFFILPPIYFRAWFLALVGGALLIAITAAYRARVGHLTALERQRTQIAMDLHDELGSQLGSIGLIADLTAETTDEARRRALLEQIAETAADMGTSLADIVWSLRRGEMTLETLARHLAAHGRRLFPAERPVFDARFPDAWRPVPLSPAAGRNVLLIGVEALHNAARHSGASHVTLTLEPDRRRWRLSIVDDGRGIAERASDREPGFGLETIRRRADAIGAALDVRSAPGQGTSIRLTFDPRAADVRIARGMSLRAPWTRHRP